MRPRSLQRLVGCWLLFISACATSRGANQEPRPSPAPADPAQPTELVWFPEDAPVDFDPAWPPPRDEFGCLIENPPAEALETTGFDVVVVPADARPSANLSPEEKAALREKRRLRELKSLLSRSKTGLQYLRPGAAGSASEFDRAICDGQLGAARQVLQRISDAAPAGEAPPVTSAEIDLDIETIRYGFEEAWRITGEGFADDLAKLSEPDLRALGRPVYRMWVQRSFRGSYVIRVEDDGEYGTVAMKIASWHGSSAPFFRHAARRITAAEVAAVAACFAEIEPVSPEADNYFQNDGTTALMEAYTPAGYRATHYGKGETPTDCDRLLLRLPAIEFDPYD